jgi:hypothetical protein
LAKDIEERKKLTFEQAEGIEPLPSQLKLREVSPKLRAVLWETTQKYLDDATEPSDYGSGYIEGPWSTTQLGHRAMSERCQTRKWTILAGRNSKPFYLRTVGGG